MANPRFASRVRRPLSTARAGQASRGARSRDFTAPPPARAPTDTVGFDFAKLRIAAPPPSGETRVSVPPAVRDMLREPGQPLPPEVGARLGPELAGRRVPSPVAATPRAIRLSHPHDAAEQAADATAARARRAAEPGADRDRRRPGRGHFADIRVHAGATGARAADSVNALAFAAGRHLVFGRDQYRPGTPTGDDLIAHELAHVAQQRAPDADGGGGELAVQRRTSGYPKDPESPTYHIFKPKKLNVKGPFTGALLEFLSLWYHAGPVDGDDKTGALIIALLESSPTFMEMAATLDKHYAVDANPEVVVARGERGTMFVTAGTVYPTKGGKVGDTVDVRNYDMIMIDFQSDPRTHLGSAETPANAAATVDEVRAVALVRAIVHETTHAFRQITGAKAGGLKGYLSDEAATRTGERKAIQEVAAASKSAGVKAEAADAVQKFVGAGKVTKLDVALSLVSGEGITYLEKFFVDDAIGSVYGKFTASANVGVRGLDALADPASVTVKTAADLEKAFQSLLDDLSKPPPPPTPSASPPSPPPSKTAASKTPGKFKPPPKTPAPFVLGAAAAAHLGDLLKKAHTLPELQAEATASGKVKSPEERALLLYAVFLKEQEIARQLADGHAKTSLSSGSSKYKDFCNDLAARFLGLKKPYDAL